MDESAYIAQSFYADYLVAGRSNDPAWLDYAAYDLPPLPKYLIGIALRIGGFPRPGPTAAAAWYDNPGRRFGSEAALNVARIPSIVLGAVGCVAIYAIGTRAFGRPTGLLAALLLLISPLYRLHSRRAMSDVPAEAFILLALAFGLSAWSRWIAGKEGWKAFGEMVIGAGICSGLAVLSKLNGAIAGMVLACWTVLALGVGRLEWASKIGLVATMVVAGVASVMTFVILNPFLTARPTGAIRPDLQGVAALTFMERSKVIADHRIQASTQARSLFPDYALRTPWDKLAVVVVQGYGRFSPMGPGHSDSTRRFDGNQDWSVVLWLPTVLSGLGVCLSRGRTQRQRNEPPTAWAVAIAVIVAWVAVTLFIPLAWDRYFLSLQPGAILLASVALTSLFRRGSSVEPS